MDLGVESWKGSAKTALPGHTKVCAKLAASCSPGYKVFFKHFGPQKSEDANQTLLLLRLKLKYIWEKYGEIWSWPGIPVLRRNGRSFPQVS